MKCWNFSIFLLNRSLELQKAINLSSLLHISKRIHSFIHSLTTHFNTFFTHTGSVGKTSLFLRFTANKFNPNHETTLQASYQNKRINLPNGKRVNLAIWVLYPQFSMIVPISLHFHILNE